LLPIYFSYVLTVIDGYFRLPYSSTYLMKNLKKMTDTRHQLAWKQ